MFEYITLERTACYGTCPVYKVVINKNGDVDYEGIAFVAIEGKRKWTLKPKKIEQLVKLIKEFDFKNFQYNPKGPCCTDLPFCITTVKFLDGTVKEIDHYLGYPEFRDSLEKFEDNIDRIIGSKKYTFLP
jgi:hypothetical protein